jgi:hypothetical protein
MADCLPPEPRPRYEELWQVYGANPDCLNRDRHVRYLTKLKTMPVRTGDTVSATEYNGGLDLYIKRLEVYCEPK